jgi:fructose-bisphosphate aldolase class II
MSLAEPSLLFDHAIIHHYGLGAFNVYSIESVLAVFEATEAQLSPVIIQISMGTRKYIKHLAAFVETIKNFARYYSVPFFIQHDHCSSIGDCIAAIDCGVQAVMIDGSALSYEENIAMTKEVTAYARSKNVWVEAELGRLPGFEDMVFSDSAEFTNPELIPGFIAKSECNALAVAVGTAHGGVQANDYLPVNFELLKRIINACPDYPFVLHGGASLPPDLISACNNQGGQVEYLRNCSEKDINRAVNMGIKKVNMDVDNFLVFTTAVRQSLNEHPGIYDPRKYLHAGTDAFKKEVEHKLQSVVNSAKRYN